MAIWKWPLGKISAVRERDRELADKAQQGREGDGSALQAQDEFRTPEYLQRLDQNVEKDLLLLPSHYASEDYIHFLRDLKRADGNYLEEPCCPRPSRFIHRTSAIAGRTLMKHKVDQYMLLRTLRWYEKRHRLQAPGSFGLNLHLTAAVLVHSVSCSSHMCCIAWVCSPKKALVEKHQCRGSCRGRYQGEAVSALPNQHGDIPCTSGGLVAWGTSPRL